MAVAIGIYILMSTWQEGRRTLAWLIAREQMPVRDFMTMIEKEPPTRVEGTAVYLAAEAGGMPRALLNNLKFNRVLHKRNVLLTFVRPEVPFVQPEERIEVQDLGAGMCRIIARYGFMETPNVGRGASWRRRERRTVRARLDGVCGRPREPDLHLGLGMPLWRKRLFALMGRNSQLARHPLRRAESPAAGSQQPG